MKVVINSNGSGIDGNSNGYNSGMSRKPSWRSELGGVWFGC